MTDSPIEVAGVLVDPRHWINGQRVASPETFTNYSPIDGAVLGEIARGGAAEVDAAVAAARDAFPAWAALGRAASDEGTLTWFASALLGESFSAGLFLQRFHPALGLLYYPTLPFGWGGFVVAHITVASLGVLAALWLLIVTMMLRFAIHSPRAAMLQLPYLGWVSFAAYLNFHVWAFN